jgi:RNA polymerase sigma factor (sigma-70 family)
VPEKQTVEGVAERAFRRHYGQVYRYLRRRTHDHDRAEELTQQVFADAAASLRETGSPPLAWLYTVAKRRFADEAQRNERAGAFAIVAVPPADSRAYGPDVAAALSAALARLPVAQREVTVLKLVHGARFAEIGERLGVSEAAAKMRFVRALQTLRAELDQEGIAP